MFQCVLLRNQRNKFWFYNGFLIQPIGINEKNIAFNITSIGINESVTSRHHVTASRRHIICIFAPGEAWVPHWLHNLAETNCFRIPPTGINEKTILLQCSAQESTNNTFVLYGFSDATHRNQQNKHRLLCFGWESTKNYGLIVVFAFNPQESTPKTRI